MRTRFLAGAAGLAVLSLISCGGSRSGERAATSESTPAATRILVTNESSGDVTIVDPVKLEVIGRIQVGKRPRGIRASADGKTVYVALSGSPSAPPGVDESTLPPPDKSADGVGIIDATQNKLVKTIHAGSDPEDFAVSGDGKTLFVSNEDAALMTLVDIDSGKTIDSFQVGEEPEGVRLTPDGKFVYGTSEGTGTITVFNIAEHKIAAKIKVGHRPRGIAFLPDGSRAFITNENDG